MATQTLWGGRFKEPLSEIALKFSTSIDLDKQLYAEDIAGSIAHVEMLAACKILPAAEARRMGPARRQLGCQAGPRPAAGAAGCNDYSAYGSGWPHCHAE